MDWKTLNGLLISRKFWLAVIGLVAAVIMYAQGNIPAESLVDAIVVLVGILMAAIAGEDIAQKGSK